MKSLLITAAIFFATSAHAHQVYQGQTKHDGSVCILEVEQIYYEGSEEAKNLRIDVVVEVLDEHAHLDQKHNHDSFAFTLKTTALKNIYSGLGENKKDQLNVSSAVESFIPQNFAMKWLHGNHFHSLQCLNLKLADHSHE